MSHIAATFASTVAGAPLTSRESAKGKARTTNDARQAAEKAGDTFAQQAQSMQTRDADEQMPDQQAPGYDGVWQQLKQLDDEPEAMAITPGQSGSIDEAGLYHHLDLTA